MGGSTCQMYLVKEVQKMEFSEELSDLIKGRSVSVTSKLKCLNPFFLDPTGVFVLDDDSSTMLKLPLTVNIKR